MPHALVFIFRKSVFLEITKPFKTNFLLFQTQSDRPNQTRKISEKFKNKQIQNLNFHFRSLEIRTLIVEKNKNLKLQSELQNAYKQNGD